MSIKEKYDNLSPKAKKFLLWGGGGTLLIIALYFFTSVPDQSYEVKKENNKPTTNLITSGDTQGVSQESIAADLRRIEEELIAVKQQRETDQKEISALNKKQTQLSQDNNDLRFQIKNQQPTYQITPKVTKNTPNAYENELQKIYQNNDLPYSNNHVKNGDRGKDETKSDTFANEESYPEIMRFDGVASDGAEKGGALGESLNSKKESDKPKINNDEAIEGTYLPASSIIPTVALSGMDAPTAKQARENPYPMLLRVKKDAILPNNFSADIKECGILAVGYGELSSERAYLRSNTITCIRDDGAVFEAAFDSFAVGEDGKAGIRGRLVTKQGQYLAKALIAGFLQAGAEMFSVQQLPTITLGRVGDDKVNSPYQQINSNKLQGAAMKGVGGALNRLADFYMDMAQDLFPVIEIDPARSIDLIVTKGVKLNFRQTN